MNGCLIPATFSTLCLWVLVVFFNSVPCCFTTSSWDCPDTSRRIFSISFALFLRSGDAARLEDFLGTDTFFITIGCPRVLQRTVDLSSDSESLIRVSCVWYASSSLLSGKLKELIDLSWIFCDSNGDVAQSTVCFVSGVFICGDVAQSTACFVSGVFICGDVAQSTACFVSGVFICGNVAQSEISIVWGVLFGVVVWKHICVLSGVKCSDEAVDVGTSDWFGKETFFIGVDVPAGENGDMALLSWSILLPLSESDTVVLQAVNT